MKLNHVNDKILLSDIKKLVGDERKSQLLILYHLQEIDRRKLFSDVKYGSLFDYCVKELGYSEGAAQRRIVAARLLKNIPEVAGKIASGNLTLTNIAQVTQFYKDPVEQKAALKKVEGLSKKECEKKLFELSARAIESRENSRRVSKDKIQIAIVLSDETMAAMEEVKKLLGRDFDSDELIMYAMEAALEKIKKSKFKQTDRPKSPPLAKVNKSRVISAHVKREIFRRDKKCTNCGSIHELNYDHRQPFSLGGTSGIENIRLLCFQCNQRARIKMKL